MSIPVDVKELGGVLADFGTGYLLTVSQGNAVKAVSVAPALVDGALVVSSPGRGSLANAAANPTVTVLFPPLVAGGHTLLVDGAATVVGEDVRVEATGAVLHKAVG